MVNNSKSCSISNIVKKFICLDGQKRSVPANCSQYELCRNGIWKRTSCTEFTYYNPEQQLCLEPRDDMVCAYAKVSGLPECTPERENALLPSKSGYCGSYLRCAHGKWRSKNCPKQQYFATTLQTCISITTNGSNDTNVCTQSAEENRELNATFTRRCMHTQVRAYERNCAMFFMCLEGEWWFQYCPLGMYFHPTQNYCVPNEAGQCPTAQLMVSASEKLDQQQCLREGALRASTTGCAQFYVCVAGKWHQQTCAPRQYYNVAHESCLPEDGTCVSINNGGVAAQHCSESSRRSFPLNCTAYEQCVQDAWVRRDCMNNTVFDDVIGICVSNDGSCSSNGLRRACRVGEHKAHPHSENCAEFYHCAGGNWQVAVCLKGYRYEQFGGICVAGTCGKLENTLEFGSADPDAVIEDGTLGNPCSDKGDGVAVPHPNNCGKFYLCYNGNITNEQSCTSGSFFDANTTYCRPNDGTCEIPLTGLCEGQQNGTKVQNPNDCSSYYLCSTVYGTQLFVCPEGEYYHNFTRQCRTDHGQCRKEPTRSVCADQKHGSRLPHELYCNIYYACVRGLAVPVECPDDYKFNAVLRRCLPDTERECQNGFLVDGSNSTYSCGNLTDGSYIADKSDCTKYYICTGGVAQHQECNSGGFFDPDYKMCMPDDGSCPLVDTDKPNQKPVPPDPIVCIGKHGDLMPDPANCNNFYACINSKLRHERCYLSNFFNWTNYQCQAYDNDAIVEVDSSEEIELSAAVTKQCLDQPTNSTNLCVGRDDGSPMANQGDCRLYISCHEEQAVPDRCRNGESFDSILGFCRQNDGTCQLDDGQRVGVCNGKHGQLTRDVDDCRGYFVCMNGQKIASKCADDEYFERTVNMCQKDVLQRCKLNAKTEDGLATGSGLLTEKLSPVAQHRYPDEKVCANATIGQRFVNQDDDCRSYYICKSSGSISYENCPIGMLFNVESDSCEGAENVICVALVNMD